MSYLTSAIVLLRAETGRHLMQKFPLERRILDQLILVLVLLLETLQCLCTARNRFQRVAGLQWDVKPEV